MQRVPVLLGPGDDALIVRRIRIDAKDDLSPRGIAIAESCVMSAEPMHRTVDRIEVHGRQHSWDLRSVPHMQPNSIVTQLIDEVSPPVRVQSRWVQDIKHALKRRIGQRTDKIECRRTGLADGPEHFLGPFYCPCVAPNYAAHSLAMKVLWEGRSRRHDQEGEEAVDVF